MNDNGTLVKAAVLLGKKTDGPIDGRTYIDIYDINY